MGRYYCVEGASKHCRVGSARRYCCAEEVSAIIWTMPLECEAEEEDTGSPRTFPLGFFLQTTSL